MKRLRLTLALLALCIPSLVQGQNAKIKQVSVQGTQTLEGADLFNSYCAVCHGKDGKGGGPAAEALKKRPSDLTQIARKDNGKFEPLCIQNTITGADVVAAHGSREMPTWGIVFGSMGGDDGTQRLRINSLVNYIDKMQAK